MSEGMSGTRGKPRSSRVIRWGIIGCGNVTEKKSGPGLQKADGSELVAVMRRNGELAADYARRHAVPRWYDDADRLIEDRDVDAVYIATPPSTHRPYALKAAGAGKPVYVEKPMAQNYAECIEMIEACEAAGVPLFVAYYRRTLPVFVRLRELLLDGAIGIPVAVNIAYYSRSRPADTDPANWRVNPEVAGCGYFCDLASHMFDLLQHFLGEVVEAGGRTANQGGRYDAEDAVCAHFEFSNGAVGSGIWNFNAGVDLDRTEIVGTAGKIVYPVFTGEPFEVHRHGGIEKIDIPYPEHVQQPLIQTIVDELRGSGECPSSGRTAAWTNWVMDRILGRN